LDCYPHSVVDSCFFCTIKQQDQDKEWSGPNTGLRIAETRRPGSFLRSYFSLPRGYREIKEAFIIKEAFFNCALAAPTSCLHTQPLKARTAIGVRGGGIGEINQTANLPPALKEIYIFFLYLHICACIEY
jgi:hypothetical protein